MATGFISAVVDVGDVELGFKAMTRRAHALTPVFKRIAVALKTDQKSHARERMGPTSAWPRRAASTLERLRKSAMKRSVPRPLGKLLSAVTYRSDSASASAESKIDWSEAHNEGAVVGRGVRLPARTFLWISRRPLDVAEDLIESALLAAFGGGF